MKVKRGQTISALLAVTCLLADRREWSKVTAWPIYGCRAHEITSLSCIPSILFCAKLQEPSKCQSHFYLGNMRHTGHVQLPVRPQPLHRRPHELPVAGVQADLGAELHPADGRRVVTRPQRELAHLRPRVSRVCCHVSRYLVPGLVVEVQDHSLHPGIVSVPRVIHIAAVDL